MEVTFSFHQNEVCPFICRFYSLWDTGYAKIHIPIIASVSEHQPTTWFSFFFDLHILVATFPAGLWYVIKNINDERVFSKYFSFLLFRSSILLFNSNYLNRSCPLRFECRLFRRSDGPFDAYSHASGLHVERCRLFGIIGVILERRRRYAETGRERRRRAFDS